jgi:hypothetical protein
MEVSAPASLVTPAGTISFNSGVFNGASVFYFTSLEGLDDPELRVTLDNKSREDGAVVHAIYAGAIHATLEGWIYTNDPATRNASRAALKAALDSIRTDDGTFTVTETGQSAKSLTVRADQPLQTATVQTTIHSFQFGLVAASGAWT